MKTKKIKAFALKWTTKNKGCKKPFITLIISSTKIGVIKKWGDGNNLLRLSDSFKREKLKNGEAEIVQVSIVELPRKKKV